MMMIIGNVDGLRTRKNWLDVVLSLTTQNLNKLYSQSIAMFRTWVPSAGYISL